MATITEARTERTPTPERPLPRLENGDCVSRAEFLRRAEAMTDVKKIERIEGIVYMQAAVRFVQHGEPHNQLGTWLGVYRAYTPGTEAGDDSTLQLDLDNDPQPDAFLRIAPECGGQSGTTEDGYVTGAAELAGEVAASSVSYDLHLKLHVYRRSGVQEYIVWKVEEQEIVWFRLCDGQYVPLTPDPQGVVRSEMFPGLWLDVPAMLRRDMAQVLRVLNEGIATREHAEFVDRLKASEEGSRPAT